MRRRIVLAAVLVLAPALARAQESATFHLRVPEAGESIAYTTGGVIQLQTVASAQGRELRNQSVDIKATGNYRLDILDANADAPRRGRVRYFQSEATSATGQDAAKREVKPVAGKTYLLTAGDSGLRVTDEQGRPVSDEEDKAVQTDFRLFGHPDTLCQYLNGKTLSVGQSLDGLRPDMAASLLGGDSADDKIEQMFFQLQRIEHHAGLTWAVFQVRMAGTTDVSDTPMRMALAGYATLTAEDCRLRSAHLEALMSMQDKLKTQDGMDVDLRVQGNARILMQLVYGQ
jgi:hypothetical protein